MMKDNGRDDNRSRKQNGKRNKNRQGDNRSAKGNNNFAKGGKNRNFPATNVNEKKHESSRSRLKWIPAKLITTPLPAPICPHCQKEIKDIAQAFTDRNSGEAIHFDCTIERIKQMEALEYGESVVYIGAGRFGIIRLAVPNLLRSFKIKKIIEWENKDERAVWRDDIADHYSLT
ncbi:MAG: hypothetical protein Ta2F_12310 [Termitinemataceae bacterium]|nr:MAG: hypothetical protein Ta2F_12310 [Termitinemataceae bacterium]